MFENETICRRCGILVVLKNRKRNAVLCADCRAKPKNVVSYGDNKCIAWNGDFHPDTDWPMFNDELVLPGKRLCGHADCVNAEHIERVQNEL